ncbi:hypothetical protein CSQ79_16570 [Gloeocapsopsis sp. IPPAS B-1203]|nr:hypothetical protein CSQ79_16570 [Gloeocapsopsis sp. IPPAS B-1203]
MIQTTARLFLFLRILHFLQLLPSLGSQKMLSQRFYLKAKYLGYNPEPCVMERSLFLLVAFILIAIVAEFLFQF